MRINVKIEGEIRCGSNTFKSITCLEEQSQKQMKYVLQLLKENSALAEMNRWRERYSGKITTSESVKHEITSKYTFVCTRIFTLG